MEIVTENAQATQKLGTELADRILKSASWRIQDDGYAKVFCLYGDLGSGKTTFTQGLAKGLGIKQRILSPTFVFIRSYTLLPTPYTLYHLDLYRIESLNDAKSLGIEEILNNEKNIVVIEWPEKIAEILPRKRTEIYFKYLDENTREIDIYSNSISK